VVRIRVDIIALEHLLIGIADLGDAEFVGDLPGFLDGNRDHHLHLGVGNVLQGVEVLFTESTGADDGDTFM
jgi:hypothetical protein